MSRAPLIRALVALGIIAASLYYALTTPARLGLDLRGGTQIVLETRDSPTVRADRESTDRAVEVLRRRVDALGVSEPNLTRSGDRRIIVELPGVTDPREAAEVIGKTAQLTFHPVLGLAGPETQPSPSGTAGTATPSPSLTSSPTSSPTASASPSPTATPSPTGTGSPSPSPTGSPTPGPGGELVLPDEGGQRLRLGPTALTGEAVSGAEGAIDAQGLGGWHVTIDFKGSGAAAWQRLTGEAACAPAGDPTRRVAIVLDNQVISSPQVDPSVACQAGIGGGSTQITGSFTATEAKELAALIRGGALPVPVEVIEQRTVGPTLGQDAIDASTRAALIGIVLTAIFIIVVYRLVGALAAVALGAYALIAYATLVALGATLTLPGLAGFVLAIGMAIDANVLVFERAREEYAAGQAPPPVPAGRGGRTSGKGGTSRTGDRTGHAAPGRAGQAGPAPRGQATPGRGLRSAVSTGFAKAWSAIIDSNVTTLLAGGLLFFLASGPVRGFGVTLAIGVLASMVSALVIARALIELALRSRWVVSRPAITGVGGLGRVRRRLNESRADLMRHGRRWLVISGVAVALAVAGIAVRGVNLGVEFTGGRLVEYSTTADLPVERARTAVSEAGFPRAIVQESGENDISVRVAGMTNDQEAQVRQALTGAAGAPVSKERDELIGPSLGDELRTKALIALAVALAAQLIYLAARFRWTFGISAVTAMAHDVLILIGVFAWLGKPLDGVFLAALLTVIGYSVNDSVVVFDRIRELWGAQPKTPFPQVVNRAILQTVPRTVNTGLGAAFILGALAVLGGDSLTDFAIALLIGIGVGTYSSMFTAAPIAIELEARRSAAPPQPKKPVGARPRREENRGSGAVL